MKINKLDVWMIVSWSIFIAFVVIDIILSAKGIYISSTLEILVGTVFGCFETVCCSVIKTNETKASYTFQLEQMKQQHDFVMEEQKQSETFRRSV